MTRENLELLLPGPEARTDRWRWGTVTQAAPLRVRLDGDDVALDLTPDALTAGLTAGDRAYCHLNGRRVVAVGLALPASGIDASKVTSGRLSGARLPVTTGLASDVDLDAVLEPGVWHQATSANATAALHYPIGLAGLLEVQARGSGTAMVWQRYTPYHPTSAGGQRCYERRHYNGTWGPWWEYVPRGAAGAPWAMAAGSVSLSLSAQAVNFVAVTFPAGRFTATPMITVSQASLPASSGLLIAKYTGASTSGFTLYAYNGPGTTVTTSATFSWLAVQMTESAGAG